MSFRLQSDQEKRLWNKMEENTEEEGGRGREEPCRRVTDKCWEKTTQRVRHAS